MHVQARKETGRVDIPQYDLGAVFEAAVNAVAFKLPRVSYRLLVRQRLIAWVDGLQNS